MLRLMAARIKTTIYLTQEQDEAVRDLASSFGTIQNVLGGALWMFSKANLADQMASVRAANDAINQPDPEKVAGEETDRAVQAAGGAPRKSQQTASNRPANSKIPPSRRSGTDDR